MCVLTTLLKIPFKKQYSILNKSEGNVNFTGLL